MGFSIPLSKWININAKKIKNNFDKNENLLSEYGLQSNIFKQYLDEHLSNKKDWSNYLWNLIVLERWLSKNIS